MAILADLLLERDDVLSSLDEAAIRAFTQRYEIPTPDDPTLFWVFVHQMRYYWPACPFKQRCVSAKWLVDNGFSDEALK